MEEDDAVARPTLQFLKRKGHNLTLTDEAGQKHRATITQVEAESVAVREEGSFTFGYCKSCNWVGAARRARGKARRDAEEHLPDCSGNGKVRIGTTNE
jgi:hypothetical protein